MKPLQVLLTRPSSQVRVLQQLVIAKGDKALLFPSLTIEALQSRPPGDGFDMIIFVSTNAVDYAIPYLAKMDLTQVKIATVGQVTKNRLEFYGFKVDFCPISNASSQDLLAIPEVQCLHHKKILIIRGLGGLETLRDTLIIRSNQVEYLEVYRRIPATITAEHNQSLQVFLAQNKGVVMIHSIDNLKNFITLVESINLHHLSKLKQYPMVLFSARIAKIAQVFGFMHLYIATKSNDDGLMEALVRAKSFYD